METVNAIRPDQRGFSLVEIMVALVIGAVGLLALAGMLTYAMQNNRQATDISIATSLARQKIEQIKLTEYNYVVSESESELNENGKPESGAKFTRVTVVEDDTPSANTKTVTVTVYYGSLSNDARRAQIKTIIFP